ncbi:hypothetical protein FD754_025547, partial [Muntiacus muntjak]
TTRTCNTHIDSHTQAHTHIVHTHEHTLGHTQKLPYTQAHTHHTYTQIHRDIPTAQAPITHTYTQAHTHPISLHHGSIVWFSSTKASLVPSPAAFTESTSQILQDTSSLLISVNPALQLLCVADSNPPAQLSWSQGSPALEAAPISSTGILEIPQVETGNEGEVTCQGRTRWAPSKFPSASLCRVKGPPSCSCETEEPQGSWPLAVTLIRGALMGAGFLLTYGLTWTYYTRCGGH